MNKSNYIAIVLSILVVLLGISALSTYKEMKAIESEKRIIEDEIDKVQKEKEVLREQKEQEEQDKLDLIKELENKDEELIKIKKRLEARTTLPKPTRGSSAGYMAFKATAYCPCPACCGKWSGGATASGVMPKQGRTIAVDTNVIPMGSKVEIKGMGTFIAEDTGSAVKGRIVDVYHNKHSDAKKFGRPDIQLKILK